MNKKGSYISLFIMIVVVFVVVLFSVVMVYVANTTQSKLHETLDQVDPSIFGSANATEVIDETFGQVTQSYSHLTWITVMLIIGMMLGIIYGSYKVRTQPIFFIPYFLITGVAIIVSAGIANSYETIVQNNILAGTFAGFVGANHFLLNLPVYMSIIGMVGGIIMFVSWATRPEDAGGYAYAGF